MGWHFERQAGILLEVHFSEARVDSIIGSGGKNLGGVGTHRPPSAASESKTTTGIRLLPPAPGSAAYSAAAAQDVEALRTVEAPRLPGEAPFSSLPTLERALLLVSYNQVFHGDLRKLAKAHPAVEKAVLAFLKHGQEPLQATTSVKGAAAAQGGTAVKEKPQVTPQVQELVAQIKANFAKWDKNNDGKLSKSEVTAALQDGSNRGKSAAAVATLYRIYDDLIGISNDRLGGEGGVSNNDLDGLLEGEKPEAGNWYHYFENRINGSDPRLFNGDPQGSAVNQGGYGSCYFLAAMVAKANQDPDFIKDMIKDNGDGTFTVTFPGRKAVTVSRPTDAELAMAANSGQNGIWASVLEKAWGQVNNDEAWFFTEKNLYEAGGDGGQLYEGIGAFSENGTDTDNLLLTRLSTTRDKLEEAFKDGKMVTAAIRSGPFTGDRAGLPKGHAYTVVAYDRETDMITLRNPWGRTEVGGQGSPRDGQDDGIFTISLAEFDSLFTLIAYEK